MYKEDLIYLVALNHFPKFGQKRLKSLKKYFLSWEKAFEAPLKKLIQAGIKESIASEFVKVRNNISLKILTQIMEKENIGIIEIEDNNYPKLLKEIYNPPTLLLYKGDISLLNTTCIGVVGARKNTSYGQQVCTKLCTDLVKNNFSIVSGLALGIDSVAHNNALDNKGKTIAVLGSGIDTASIYPPSNRYLTEKIINNKGLVISEFSLGSAPLSYHFPMRNRIIAGLSLGILIIESAIKSGALITARLALEQNREVFAVPGNIFSNMSAGPNSLIKQGATPISSVEEILETLDFQRLNSYINSKKITAHSPIEERIIPHLSLEPKHIDELARMTKLSSAELSSALTIMEIRGAIKNFGNMKYALL